MKVKWYWTVIEDDRIEVDGKTLTDETPEVELMRDAIKDALGEVTEEKYGKIVKGYLTRSVVEEEDEAPPVYEFLREMQPSNQ